MTRKHRSYSRWTEPAFCGLMQSSPELLSQILRDLTRTVRTSTERIVQQRLEQRAIAPKWSLRVIAR